MEAVDRTQKCICSSICGYIVVELWLPCSIGRAGLQVQTAVNQNQVQNDLYDMRVSSIKARKPVLNDVQRAYQKARVCRSRIICRIWAVLVMK